MSGFVRLFSLPVRCAIAVLAAAVMMVIFVGSRGGITHAQGTPAFTVLHSFSSGQGAFPIGLLPMPSGVLYGAATGGGCANCSGTVFKLVGSSSSAYTAYVLHTFGGGSDGYQPEGGLVGDNYGNVYGTTLEGGGSAACAGGCGVVYRVNQWGGETVLYRFAGGTKDGANPRGPLVIDEAINLYGTTVNGGAYGKGTVFMVNKEGVETVLYSFTGKQDGGNPWAGLVRDENGNLYGTTINGGLPGATCTFRAIPGCGTVYMLSKEGKFTVLYSFTGGSDGANSQATLVMDAQGRLYGTTIFGGAFGSGTVFMVDGEREMVLYSFSGGTDGGLPFVGVARDAAGNLYGTTLQGGNAPNPTGTVFQVTPSGQETVLFNFNGDGDEGGPPAGGGLRLDAAGNVYGTTTSGGTFGPGYAFRIHP